MKHKRTIFALFVLLLAACQQATETPIPSTEVPPEPTLTETAAPPIGTPTLVPTATPAGFPPVISGLEGQTIVEDEGFANIKLPDFVTDADHAPDEIIWSFSGQEEIKLRQSGDTLIVMPPTANWAGSETILFEACDPDGLCTSTEATFTATAENDLPTLHTIPDQYIQPGKSFEDVVLADIVKDVDHTNEEMNWHISGNQELAVEIIDGKVSVIPPSGTWSGVETLQFEVCDPENGCASTEAEYRVLGETDVLITYVYNAGFLITTGEKKILIDALNNGTKPYGGEGPPDSLVAKLENAEPPFDNVDLILTTHEDIDHFNEAIVQKHLQNNPNAIFVSTRRTVDLLKQFPEIQERLIPLDLVDGESTQLSAQGIDIEAIYLTHGEGRPNLGYIFTVGGKKLFHTGDLYVELIDVSYIENYGIPHKGIDIAFVPVFSLNPERNHREIFESFQAKQLIMMHYHFPYADGNIGLMYEYFPDAIIFQKEMRSWLAP